MHHLTVDEIIHFVSLTEMCEDAVQTCAAVNGHVRKCEKCLRRVQAFQRIHDAFARMETGEDFREFVQRSAAQQANPEAEGTQDYDR